MATRPRATRDLKITQGQRRDAYFQRLRRQTQPRKAPPASLPIEPRTASAAEAATPAPAAAPAEPAAAPSTAPATA